MLKNKNKFFSLQIATPLQNNTKPTIEPCENLMYKLLIDQSDIYSHILSKFPEEMIESKMLMWVLLEYTR